MLEKINYNRTTRIYIVEYIVDGFRHVAPSSFGLTRSIPLAFEKLSSFNWADLTKSASITLHQRPRPLQRLLTSDKSYASLM